MYHLLCVLVSAFFLVSVKAGVPGPPQSARVRIIDDDTLEVTVEPPVDDGGSAVTHYNATFYSHVDGIYGGSNGGWVTIWTDNTPMSLGTKVDFDVLSMGSGKLALTFLCAGSGYDKPTFTNLDVPTWVSPLQYNVSGTGCTRTHSHIIKFIDSANLVLFRVRTYVNGVFFREATLTELSAAWGATSYTRSNFTETFRLNVATNTPTVQILNVKVRNCNKPDIFCADNVQIQACNTNGCGSSTKVSITCNIPTSGDVTLTSDCILYSQIVVTGALNVTGVPDAQGNLPKIIGGGSNRLFKVENGGELVVRSLNLTGGDVTTGTPCNVHPDTVGCRGGAVYINQGKMRAYECTFASNGGVYGGAVAQWEGKSTFHSSTFVENEATVEGGGVWQWIGPSTHYFTKFIRNKAQSGGGGSGGGIRLAAGASSNITSGIFENNFGAGIVMFGGSTVKISDTKFGLNSVNNIFGQGTPMTLHLQNAEFVSESVEGVLPKSCNAVPTQCEDNGYQKRFVPPTKTPTKASCVLKTVR
jgi:hypothetical protein